ncbi:MAG: homoserine kinase [Candidatus Acidiferrales bacterium]|jgi:homoserine kinase
MKKSKPRSYEVRVPASSANLGAGFDCFGLALELFLTVRATVQNGPGARSEARTSGVDGSKELPSAPEENLILRAMQRAAERHGLRLPPVHLAVRNEIPIAGGLGSSAAAIVAGTALGFAVCGKKSTQESALRLAAEMEHHADNVGAALLGGLVVSFVGADGNVIALRKKWPKQIRVVTVTPKMTLETAASRAALPQTIEHAAAVHNLQRSALFLAALDERRYDLLWDAMQDRLHQSFRQALIPGLVEALAIPRMPGLLGVALSGAGPTVVAFATSNFAQIGKAIAGAFERKGLSSTIRNLAVAQQGIRVAGKPLTK